MENLKEYMTWHHLVLCLICLIAFGAFLSNDLGWLFFTIPLLIPVGIVQLITAVNFLIKKKKSEFYDSWRMYWIITVAYFIVLYFLNQSETTIGAYYFWLWCIPWLIALYQYMLVRRIHKWRKSNKAFPIITNPKF